MSLKTLVAQSLALGLLSARSALGACPETGRPVVELTAHVAPPDLVIATTLERHLRVELEAREIEVCEPPVEARRTIASMTLDVERNQKGPVRARIRVVDAVTDKIVERSLSLDGLSARARPLAVAAAADELLRASWIELEVADAPAPKMTPPAAVRNAVRASLHPAATRRKFPPRFELGVLARAGSFFGRRESAGGAAFGTYWLARRFGVRLELSAEYGLPRASSRGAVRSHDATASVAGVVALVDHGGTYGVDVFAGPGLGFVWHHASPIASARGDDAFDLAVPVRLGGEAWIRTGRMRWFVQASGAGALRYSVANDENRKVVTGIDGVGAFAALGVHFGL